MTVKFRLRAPVEHPLMRTIVLGRNPDWGAPQIFISGRVGAGKTSLLEDLAYRVLKRRGKSGRPKNEYVFWKGQESCQWKRLADNGTDVKILAPNGIDVKFYNQAGKENQEYVIHRFETNAELWKLAELGKLNVLYMEWKQLTDFMRWVQVHKFDWTDFFVDEVESWAPEGAREKQYRENIKVSNVLAEARKSFQAVYGATQAEQTIAWQVRKKLMGHIFLMGATHIGMNPLYQQAIHALRLGEGWVTIGGEYEKFKFKTFLARGRIRARIKVGANADRKLSPRSKDAKGRFLPEHDFETHEEPIVETEAFKELVKPMKKKPDIHSEGMTLAELISGPEDEPEETEEEDEGEREWKRAEARAIAAEMNAEKNAALAELIAPEGMSLKRNETNEDEEVEEE